MAGDRTTDRDDHPLLPRQPRVIRPHRQTDQPQQRTDAPESPATSYLVLPEELSTTRLPVLGPPALPETVPLPRDGPPTEAQIEALKRSWLRMPLFDIEYVRGFEAVREELAAWHEAQLEARRKLLGAGPLMIGVVEELARCWIDGRPPQTERAKQLLRVFG